MKRGKRKTGRQREETKNRGEEGGKRGVIRQAD